MEKFSFYHFMSVILPGSFLLSILFFLWGGKIQEPASLKLLHWLLLATFAIFLGVVVHIGSFKLLKLYRKIGLYKPIYKIYTKSSHLQPIKEYINKAYRAAFNKTEADAIDQAEFGLFYDMVYYKLDADGKIETARSFQGFYFFFRNFFLATILSFICFGIFYIFGTLPPGFYMALMLLIIMAFISWHAAKWYRNKMAEKMFWAYYSNEN